jgi:hypothetical protein
MDCRPLPAVTNYAQCINTKRHHTARTHAKGSTQPYSLPACLAAAPVAPAAPHCTQPAAPGSACQSHSCAWKSTTKQHSSSSHSIEHMHSASSNGKLAHDITKSEGCLVLTTEHTHHNMCAIIVLTDKPAIATVKFAGCQQAAVWGAPVVCSEAHAHARLQQQQRALLQVLQQQHMPRAAGTEALEVLERSRGPGGGSKCRTSRQRIVQRT